VLLIDPDETDETPAVNLDNGAVETALVIRSGGACVDDGVRSGVVVGSALEDEKAARDETRALSICEIADTIKDCTLGVGGVGVLLFVDILEADDGVVEDWRLEVEMCELAELATALDTEESPFCAALELDADTEDDCFGVTDALDTDVITTDETISLRDEEIACWSLVVEALSEVSGLVEGTMGVTVAFDQC
jgi:hypothetical protein